MKTARNTNISPVRKLKVQRDLDHWRAAERNIRAQLRTTETGGKESTNYLWVQGMLWGLPLEICRSWPWAAVKALPPLLPSAQEWLLHWLCANLCFYKSSILPCRMQTAPKGSMAALQVLMATPQGRLRDKVKDNYLRWNILSCCNSFRQIPAKHLPPPTLQAELSPTKFPSHSHLKLFPKTMPCPSWSQRD